MATTAELVDAAAAGATTPVSSPARQTSRGLPEVPLRVVEGEARGSVARARSRTRPDTRAKPSTAVPATRPLRQDPDVAYARLLQQQERCAHAAAGAAAPGS